MAHTNNFGKIQGNSVEAGNDENYVQITSESAIRYKGTTTVWKDMIMDLFGRRLYNNVGTVDYDYNENCIVFEPNGGITDVNDRLGGNQEINHEMKVGFNIEFRPHIHWWQQVTSNTVKPVVFTMRYRLQRNGEAKETSWTTLTANAGSGGDDLFDFTSEADGLYNQLTEFPSITVDCGLSDTFQIQMTRTDSETGDVSVVFFDLHAEVDSDGSDTEYSKA